MASAFQLIDPDRERCRSILDEMQYGPSAVDKEFAEITVASLRYPNQLRFPASAYLAGDQPEPGGHVSPFSKDPTIAHGSDQSTGDHRANARDLGEPSHIRVPLRHLFDLGIQVVDTPVQVDQFGRHIIEQDHNAWPKIIVGCLDDILERALEDVSPLTDANTPFGQETAGLIDQPRPIVDQSLPLAV
jgi:hypothetical protein